MGAEGALTAIVLAAGQSRRMGAPNKLLLDVGGRPVLARVVAAFMATEVLRIVVVTGADREAVKGAMPETNRIRVVHNPEHATGMGSSIRCGVSAAEAGSNAFAICPGDLPLLTTETVRRVIRAFLGQEAPCIVRPRVDGLSGHPVLFDGAYRDELMQLQSDKGARDILWHHKQAVTYVDMDAPGAIRDVDTPLALRAVRAQLAADTSSSDGRESPA